MTDVPEPPSPRVRPWWRSRSAHVAVLAALLLGMLLANSALAWLSWTVWTVALVALTVWLLAPDLMWAWREHPEVVRRVLVLATRPRTIRVVLYVLLAYAWYVTVF